MTTTTLQFGSWEHVPKAPEHTGKEEVLKSKKYAPIYKLKKSNSIKKPRIATTIAQLREWALEDNKNNNKNMDKQTIIKSIKTGTFNELVEAEALKNPQFAERLKNDLEERNESINKIRESIKV